MDAITFHVEIGPLFGDVLAGDIGLHGTYARTPSASREQTPAGRHVFTCEDRVASDAFALVESTSVLGQSNEAVLASRVCSTVGKTAQASDRRDVHD